MSHHENQSATADNSNVASDVPSSVAAYVPLYLLPTSRDRAYRDAKLAWLRDHPAATSQQVEAAFRELSEACGL